MDKLKARRNGGAPQYLLFIDTNILLDFYRARNDAGLHLLDTIDQNHRCIVTSYQVEMEFKKNRQRVIVESLKNLKLPEAKAEVQGRQGRGRHAAERR
jgi:predicted nucleic acid-binding protein